MPVPTTCSGSAPAWRSLYAEYGADLLDYAPDAWVLAALARLGRSDGVLLDVGCGSGRHLGAALDLGWRVQGVDASAIALAAARSRLSAAGRGPCDLRELDFERDELPAADAALCIDVVSVTREPRRMLERLGRAVVAGGRVLLTIQSVEDETCGVGTLQASRPGSWLAYEDGPLSQRFYTQSGMIALFAESGLTILSIETAYRDDEPHAHRPWPHRHALFGVLAHA